MPERCDGGIPRQPADRRGRLLIRYRGPQEWGLAWTTAADVHLVDPSGAPGAPGELDGWSPPTELPLHVEVLRSRPEAASVVHVHPRAVVAADLAGLAIRPIVGAFDIPGAKLAVGGVPVYRRGVLVRNRGLALEMAAAMGKRPVVVLRGHGLTQRWIGPGSGPAGDQRGLSGPAVPSDRRCGRGAGGSAGRGLGGAARPRTGLQRGRGVAA